MGPAIGCPVFVANSGHFTHLAAGTWVAHGCYVTAPLGLLSFRLRRLWRPAPPHDSPLRLLLRLALASLVAPCLAPSRRARTAWEGARAVGAAACRRPRPAGAAYVPPSAARRGPRARQRGSGGR